VLLEGKRIVVTGGASGIAAATLRAYAREGAAVVSLDIDAAAGAAAAKEANAVGPGTVAFAACDVSRGDEVSRVLADATARLGGLDVLVNLAGVEHIKPASEVTEAELDRVAGVNIKGTMFTNQAAFTAMRETGGAIVNVASLAGVIGAPGLASYSATKGAVLGWTRSVAREWGPYGIRVNAICPLIWTPMFDRHRATMTPEDLAAYDAAMARAIPLGGRYGDPDRDMAPVMVFLASDMSRFITGQTLPVDGGYLVLS
jgi:NAD(P)-dependent dehydrogenase (short-subunit alcohol dehydrogenase family)